MRLAPALLLVLSFVFSASAQQAGDAPPREKPPQKAVQWGPATEVPLGSTDNTVALTVANASGAAMKDVRVRLAEAPEWVQAAQPEKALNPIAAGETKRVRFRFAVAEDAPVGKAQTLRFDVTSAGGTTVGHPVRVAAGAPSEFGIAGNYPNPFRQKTTIAYDLPAPTQVRVEVYDVLGRRVKVLVDEKQEAGRQTVSLKAGGLSSGVYFYRVETDDHTEDGRVVLVR